MKKIKPINNNGSVALQFTVQGKRYKFSPIPGADWDSPRDRAAVEAVGIKISLDIVSGNFDPTLNKYRPNPKPDKEKPQTLLELWDRWKDELNLTPEAAAVHYYYIRQMILKAKPKILDTKWLTEAKLSPRTIQDRLSYMRSCFSWAMDHKLVDSNPWKSIKPNNRNKKQIKPFSQDEINRIIEGFQELEPHYVSFVLFLLMTGARPSEAAGLQWRHVDFQKGYVIIEESLSVDRTGNGYKKVRKTTKTSNIRYLDMSQELKELLESMYSNNKDPNDLIFKTVRGKVIDYRAFRKDRWIKVLEAKEIPYRKLYSTRHTMISHAIEKGMPLTGVAYIAGHKDTKMVMTTYGHMVNRPRLPELGINIKRKEKEESEDLDK